MTPLNSRSNAPIQTILVGEELTTCIYDGTRTLLDGIGMGNVRREHCPRCGQRYDVEDEEEGDG